MFLTFKGTKPAYVSVMAVGRPYKAPVNWETFEVPGRAGALLVEKTVEPITIPVTMMVEGQDREEYLRNGEDFSSWLNSEKEEPLIFSDNPNRTYYAVTQGAVLPDDELNIYGVVTVEFFVPFPYKFGEEETAPFVNGVAEVFNNGSMPVRPTIYAEVLEDITHLDILGEGKYLRVGEPADLGQSIAEPYTKMFDNPMVNLTGWVASGTAVDGGTVAGSFAIVEGNFAASSYGSATGGWPGPALRQNIVGGPLTDFRVDVRVRLPTVEGVYGRAEVYLLNDQGVAIGKLAIKRTQVTPGNVVELRIGGGSTYTFPINYGGGPNRREWNNFDGILRFEKRGNVFNFYVANMDRNNNDRHFNAHAAQFIDEEFKYVVNLASVQPHIGRPWNQTTALNARIIDIKVWRYNEVPDTDPRIIARVGDLIEVNFKDSAIYINGEERRDLKDIFSRFFSLPRGKSNLAIDPVGKVNAVAVIREGFE